MQAASSRTTSTAVLELGLADAVFGQKFRSARQVAHSFPHCFSLAWPRVRWPVVLCQAGSNAQVISASWLPQTLRAWVWQRIPLLLLLVTGIAFDLAPGISNV